MCITIGLMSIVNCAESTYCFTRLREDDKCMAFILIEKVNLRTNMNYCKLFIVL